MSEPVGEIVVLGDVTFERLAGGREIARRGSKIIADITPDGEGYGGWVYWLGGEARKRFDRFNLEFVESRVAGRELIAGWIE